MESWIQRILKFGWLGLFLVLAGNSFLSMFSPDEIQPFSQALVTLFISLAGIGFYVLVVYGQPAKADLESDVASNANSLGWRTYFFAVLLCAAVIIVVNPRGLYGVKIFPQLSNAIKQEKVRYYRQLEFNPEVIILGSSRTLTLSPLYLEETTGYSTYNFGISGVTQIELALQGKMISAKQAEAMPKVVLLEISPSSLQPINESDLAEVPIEFLPYMSVEQGAQFLLERVLDLFSGYQFTEAVYVLQFIQQDRTPQNYWEVSPDGSSRFFPKETLDEALDRQLEQREQQDQSPCRNFSKGGDRLIRDYADLAVEKQFTLIYYYSPFHPQFREEYLIESDDYSWCLDIFLELMQELTDQNPNIFFVDLNDPATAGLRTDGTGFYDGFHITPASADLVIDALRPTIFAGYEAAQEMRKDLP